MGIYARATGQRKSVYDVEEGRLHFPNNPREGSWFFKFSLNWKHLVSLKAKGPGRGHIPGGSYGTVTLFLGGIVVVFKINFRQVGHENVIMHPVCHILKFGKLLSTGASSFLSLQLCLCISTLRWIETIKFPHFLAMFCSTWFVDFTVKTFLLPFFYIIHCSHINNFFYANVYCTYILCMHNE